MSLAHIGLGVFVIGITFTSTYSVEKDVKMAPGDTYTTGDFTFRFDGIDQQRGPNYLAETGTITVLQDGRLTAILNPEKRIYLVQQMPMTEAAIDAGLTRDLYVALGEPLDDGGSWAVRLYLKPYVRWIWLGALIMVFGGVLSASDRRYRRLTRDAATQPIANSSHATS
jgi:cytochrome c-type biogenesis protein CcmF